MRVGISILALLLPMSLACASADTVSVKPAVAHLVSPVLKAYARYIDAKQQHGVDQLENSLDAVLFDKSEAATEALAILLGIYIGEHSAEEVSCELIQRGSSALPFLQLYSTKAPTVPGVVMSRFTRNTSQYAGVVLSITKGERCESDD